MIPLISLLPFLWCKITRPLQVGLPFQVKLNWYGKQIKRLLVTHWAFIANCNVYSQIAEECYLAKNIHMHHLKAFKDNNNVFASCHWCTSSIFSLWRHNRPQLLDRNRVAEGSFSACVCELRVKWPSPRRKVHTERLNEELSAPSVMNCVAVKERGDWWDWWMLRPEMAAQRVSRVSLWHLAPSRKSHYLPGREPGRFFTASWWAVTCSGPWYWPPGAGTFA